MPLMVASSKFLHIHPYIEVFKCHSASLQIKHLLCQREIVAQLELLLLNECRLPHIVDESFRLLAGLLLLCTTPCISRSASWSSSFPFFLSPCLHPFDRLHLNETMLCLVDDAITPSFQLFSLVLLKKLIQIWTNLFTLHSGYKPQKNLKFFKLKMCLLNLGKIFRIKFPKNSKINFSEIYKK